MKNKAQCVSQLFAAVTVFNMQTFYHQAKEKKNLITVRPSY